MKKIVVDNVNFTFENGKIIIDCPNGDLAALFQHVQNTVKVGELEVGAKFTVEDETFVVLDKSGDSVLIIRDEFLLNTDEFGNNSDWRKSPIRAMLNNGNYYKKMDRLFGADNILYMERDLTSLDGLDDYGTCTDAVTMLTSAEYAKYHKILGLKSNYPNWWWTITPASTPSNGYSGSVCCVSSAGILNWDGCGCSCGVRPVLNLNSSTLVSCEK